jgi:hypothetical protein
MHAVPQAGPSGRADGGACAAVLAQPSLVDAIRARIASPLDALAFAIAVAPCKDFALDMSEICPLTDVRAAELADVLAASGQVTGLDLAFSSVLTDGGVAHIARLRSLRSLELAGSLSLTDAAFPFLRRLTSLTSLGLAFTPISDAGLAAVAALTTLQRLDLLGCDGVTASGIAHLSSLVGLTSLRTPRAYILWELEPAAVSAGRRMAHAMSPVLRLLSLALADLAAPSGGQASLVLAGRLGALQHLDLGNCDVADLRLLASTLPGLTTLVLNFRYPDAKLEPLTAPDVEHLCRGLPSLRQLTLRLAEFADFDALRGLAALGGLKRPELVGAAAEEPLFLGSVLEEGLRLGAIVPTLTGLTSICMCNVTLCDADVFAIARHLPNLAKLELLCSGVTVTALAEVSRLS